MFLERAVSFSGGTRVATRITKLDDMIDGLGDW